MDCARSYLESIRDVEDPMKGAGEVCRQFDELAKAIESGEEDLKEEERIVVKYQVSQIRRVMRTSRDPKQP